MAHTFEVHSRSLVSPGTILIMEDGQRIVKQLLWPCTVLGQPGNEVQRKGLMGVWLHSVSRDQCCPSFGHWDTAKQTNNESALRMDHPLACVCDSIHAEHRLGYKQYNISKPLHIFKQKKNSVQYEMSFPRKLFEMRKDRLLCTIQSCYLSLTLHLSFSTSHLSKSISVLLFSIVALTHN